MRAHRPFRISYYYGLQLLQASRAGFHYWLLCKMPQQRKACQILLASRLAAADIISEIIDD